jgi:GAF domain-containing protein
MDGETKGCNIYLLDPVDRVAEYAAWVKELRRGKIGAPLPLDDSGPLARLGRELQLLSEGIARREEELRRLFHIVHKVERGVLVEDVLDGIFDGFAGIIPYNRIGCAFLTDAGVKLTSYWARSNLGPTQIDKGYSWPVAGSSIRDVLRTGEPRILNDLEGYLAAHPKSDSTRRIVAEGCRSSLSCPLIVDGSPFGVLFFSSREKDTYHDIHQTIFLQIAEEVATVIRNSRLFHKLIDHNQFLIRQAEQLEVAANRDALTGVLNRGAIMVTLV